MSIESAWASVPHYPVKFRRVEFSRFAARLANRLLSLRDNQPGRRHGKNGAIWIN